MTMLRMLSAALAAAFALAPCPASAEMKKDGVEYSHGDTKSRLYGLRRPGDGQAPRRADDPRAQGMTPRRCS